MATSTNEIQALAFHGTRARKYQRAVPAHLLTPEEPLRSLAEAHIQGASFSPAQLTLEAGLPEDEWQSIGEKVFNVHKASMFWIGDWLNYGRETYGPVAAYALAGQVSGLSRPSLYRACWVAKKFAPERRRLSLSFNHHYIIAAQPDAVADKILSEAEELGLSCSQVKKIASAEGAQTRGSLDEHQRLTIHVYPETYDKLRAMAQEADMRVDWFATRALEDWLRWRGHGDCLRPSTTSKRINTERDVAGLCLACGGPRDDERKTCAKCRKYQQEWYEKNRSPRRTRKELPA